MLQSFGIGDIVIKIHLDGSTTYGVLKEIMHVPNLDKNLFSSYVATQKRMYTLFMENGYQVLEGGTLSSVSGVVFWQLYRLLFEAVPPAAMTIAYVGSSFSYTTKRECTQSLDH